jgi:hypothetical protein
MDWKEFFKPNKKKLITTAIFFVFIFIVYFFFKMSILCDCELQYRFSSDELNISVEELEQNIEQYKEQGTPGYLPALSLCTCFHPQEKYQFLVEIIYDATVILIMIIIAYLISCLIFIKK